MNCLTSNGDSNGLGRLKQPVVALGCLFFLAAVWILSSTLDSPWNLFANNQARYPFLLSHLQINGSSHSPPAILKPFFTPMPLTRHSFTAANGKNYTLADDTLRWKESLREQVLILDMDTRSLHGETQILHNESVPWGTMDASSTGLLNHYMFALIHGYTYKLIRPRAPKDRFASWVKPGVIADTLKKYRIVVFMDADALWAYPEIPLEWLLNHWNITQDTSLAISRDPRMFKDAFGRTGLNTGFIIAQQNPRTEEILASWADCPSGQQFPGCEKYANRRVYEQTAFNNYVRYAFNETEDIRELSCDETDGYPGLGWGCDGVFVRHFWWDKARVKTDAPPMMRNLSQTLHKHFLDHVEHLVVEETADP